MTSAGFFPPSLSVCLFPYTIFRSASLCLFSFSLSLSLISLPPEGRLSCNCLKSMSSILEILKELQGAPFLLHYT